MDDHALRIDPTSRRGRKLIDAAFRAIAKWRPAYEWRTVVVQPNCAVRIGRLGDVSDHAPADQRTTDGRRIASRQSPCAQRAPRRREGLIGQISGRLCIRRPKDFAAPGC